jgi:hypothetical protein
MGYSFRWGHPFEAKWGTKEGSDFDRAISKWLIFPEFIGILMSKLTYHASRFEIFTAMKI